MHASFISLRKKKQNQQEKDVRDDALESWKYLDCNKNVTLDHVVMASLTFKWEWVSRAKKNVVFVVVVVGRVQVHYETCEPAGHALFNRVQ